MSKAHESQVYQFLHEEPKDLVRVINNYYSLGQFELARLFSLLLKEKDSELYHNVTYSLIQNGVPEDWYVLFTHIIVVKVLIYLVKVNFRICPFPCSFNLALIY